jgi:replicative DNA helicase
MTPEIQLLVKIINTGGLPSVIEWGVDEEDFRSEEARGIFNSIKDVYLDPMSGGSMIGPATCKQRFSHLPLEHGDDPHVKLEYLCAEVRKARITRDLLEASQKQCELLASGQLTEALRIMEDAQLRAHALDFSRNIDINGKRGFGEFKQRYLEKKRGEYRGAMEWAWKPLNALLGPIERSDYIIFYGRPKNMKTWVLLYQMFDTLMSNADSRIVLYTKEMSYQEMYERLASILVAVSYTAVRRAQLNAREEHALFEQIDWITEQWKVGERITVLSAKDAVGRDTVSWLGAKCKKHKATAVFVDGIYLLAPHNQRTTKMHERILSVSRDLRQMILNEGIPCMGTVQANRQAAGNDRAETSDVAGSDSLAQDATGVIRVIKDKVEDGAPQTLSLPVAASRAWDIAGWKIHGIPSSDFSFAGLLSEQEAIKAQLSEDDKEVGKGKKQGKQVQNGAGKPAARTPVDPTQIRNQLKNLPSNG